MATKAEPREMRGPKLEAYQIVIRPLLTEKGTHQSEHHDAYPFEVNPWATKDEIKAAIEDARAEGADGEPAGQDAAVPLPGRAAVALEEGRRHAAPR
jgi:hypothetical protein